MTNSALCVTVAPLFHLQLGCMPAMVLKIQLSVVSALEDPGQGTPHLQRGDATNSVSNRSGHAAVTVPEPLCTTLQHDHQ